MYARVAALTIALALLVSPASRASDAPATPNGSLAIGQQVPLVPLLTALALQARIRIFILPGTPNTAQIGSISAPSAKANLLQLVALNGLVARESPAGGTLLIGTPLAMEAVFPTRGPVGSSTTKLERVLVPVVGVDPATLLKEIEAQLPPGTIAIPTNRNAIYVIGSQRAVDLIARNAAPLSGAAVPMTVYRPNYITAAHALTEINAHLPPTPPESVVADASANTLSIAGPSGYLAQIVDLMKAVDVPVRSVDYDVIIAEADPNIINVQAGTTLGQAQTTYQSVGTTAVGQVAPPTPWIGIFGFPLSLGMNLAGQLSLSSQHGHAHVLKRLKCFVSNGETCTDGYTQSIAYASSTGAAFYGSTSYATVNVGVSLSLVPQISNNTITTAANVKYSTVDGYGVNNIPNIADRPTTTTVNTPIGQSFVLTGLYDDTESVTRTGLPFLSQLPIIGALFSTTQKTRNQEELVIIVTPNVVADAAPGINGAQFPEVPALLNGLPGGAPSPAPYPEPPAPAASAGPSWTGPTPVPSPTPPGR